MVIQILIVGLFGLNDLNPNRKRIKKMIRSVTFVEPLNGGVIESPLKGYRRTGKRGREWVEGGWLGETKERRP